MTLTQANPSAVQAAPLWRQHLVFLLFAAAMFAFFGELILLGKTFARLVVASGYTPEKGLASVGGPMVSCLFHPTCRDEILPQMWHTLPFVAYFLPPALLFTGAGLRSAPTVARKAPGQAVWATIQSLKRYLDKTGKRRGYVGCYVANGKLEILRPPLEDKEGHAWIVTGTGGGKTSRFYKPLQALSAIERSSTITIDLKYPDLTSGMMDGLLPYAMMGHHTLIYLPFEANSQRLDLLGDIKSLFDAELMAGAIIPIADNENKEYYSKTARTLLRALIYAACIRTPRIPLSELYLVVKRGAESIKSFVAAAGEQAALECELVLKLPVGQLIATLENVASELQVFSHPHVARATSAPDGNGIKVDTILRETGMLYIGLTQANVQSAWGDGLIKVLVRYLHSRIDVVSDECGGKLPVHLNINLDEWANMPRLPFISKRLAMMRSKGACYNLSIQSVNKGMETYGEIGFYGGTDNNLTHRLYIPWAIRDPKSRLELAEEIGRGSFLEQGQSTSTPLNIFDGLSARKGVSEREVDRALLSPEEMLRWEKCRAVCFVSQGPPAQVVLPRIDEKTVTVLGKTYVNPLYKMVYTQFYQGVDVRLYIQRMLDLPMLPTSAASVVVPSSASVEVPSEEPVGVLLVTLARLLDERVSVGVFDHPSRVFWDIKDAPWSERPLETLQLAGLVRRKEGRVDLTEQGMSTVSAALSERLRAGRYRRRVEKLMDDHPGEVAGLGQDVTNPVMVYQGESVLLSATVARALFTATPVHLSTKKLSGKLHYVLPLSVSGLINAFEQGEKPLLESGSNQEGESL